MTQTWSKGDLRLSVDVQAINNKCNMRYDHAILRPLASVSRNRQLSFVSWCWALASQSGLIATA